MFLNVIIIRDRMLCKMYLFVVSRDFKLCPNSCQREPIPKRIEPDMGLAVAQTLVLAMVCQRLRASMRCISVWGDSGNSAEQTDRVAMYGPRGRDVHWCVRISRDDLGSLSITSDHICEVNRALEVELHYEFRITINIINETMHCTGRCLRRCRFHLYLSFAFPNNCSLNAFSNYMF